MDLIKYFFILKQGNYYKLSRIMNVSEWVRILSKFLAMDGNQSRILTERHREGVETGLLDY